MVTDLLCMCDRPGPNPLLSVDGAAVAMPSRGASDGFDLACRHRASRGHGPTPKRSPASLHCHSDESAGRANVSGQAVQLNRKSLRNRAAVPVWCRTRSVRRAPRAHRAPESGRISEREPARPVKRLEHRRVVGHVEALAGGQAVGRLPPLTCRIASWRRRWCRPCPDDDAGLTARPLRFKPFGVRHQVASTPRAPSPLRRVGP